MLTVQSDGCLMVLVLAYGLTFIVGQRPELTLEATLRPKNTRCLLLGRIFLDGLWKRVMSFC